MTVDRESIIRIRAARAHVEELEGVLELARGQYHEAVRELHRGGASLRELAAGLGISHQRIHQIVGTAATAIEERPLPAETPVPPQMCCDYCGEERREEVPFVPGPGVGICEGCVNAAESAVDGSYRGPSGVFFTRTDPNAKEHCAFCKKSARQVNRLVAADENAVCDECLRRCRTILTRKAATKAA